MFFVTLCPVMKLLLSILWLILSAAPLWAQPNTSGFPPDSSLTAEFQMPNPCYGMPAVTYGPFIYLFGGNLPPGPTGLIERIDTRNNTIKILPALLSPRHFSCASIVGNSAYIIGGTTSLNAFSGASAIVERFDLLTEKVVRLPPAPERISMTSSAVVDGKIYIARYKQSDLLIYDPATNKWSHTPQSDIMPNPKIVAKDGTIYAFSNYGDMMCQAYDVATSTWRDLPSMPSRTSGYDLTLYGDSIFMFGEITDMTRVLRFDIKSQTWSRPVMTGFCARRLPTSCTLGDKIYVCGGKLRETGFYLSIVQVFNAAQLR